MSAQAWHNVRGSTQHAAVWLAGTIALASATATAGENTPFRYEQEVLPGGRGGNRLAVEVPLLAGSAEAGAARLEDLRLFTRAGIEAPYLLIPPPQPTRELAARSILAIAATRRSSGFEADLGAPTLIDRIRVEGLPAPFLKRVRLEGSGDRLRWTVLAAEATLFDLPAEGLRRVTVEIEPQQLRYLRLTWDDASSARAPLPRGILAREVWGGPQPAPLRTTLAFDRRESEPGTTRYRLRLPAPRLPVVGIEVVPAGGYLLRAAQVKEARLVGNEVLPVSLGAATLRRSEYQGVVLSELHIPISAPQENELDLVIEDGDNPPIEIREIAAVFAPQPWIYFESSDGEPFSARYGTIGLRAPRYDLEAARGTAMSTASAALARWGARRERPHAPTSELAGEVLSGGAAIDTKGFRVVRPVAPGPAGLTTLRLDLAVLATSPTLADLRLATAAGIQVPYLLETLSEPLAVALPAPTRLAETRSCGLAGRPGWSCYVIELPATNLPPGRVSVTTSIRVFGRRVLVRQQRPEPGREKHLDLEHRDDGFLTVLDSIWRHQDPERAAPPFSASIPPLPRRELYLAIEDGDNSPLPLVSARLFLPAYRLRFFRPPSTELRLCCGQAGLAAPRYDIALLAPRLLGASAHETTAAAVGLPGELPSTAGFSRLFVIVLIGAVVVLLIVIARLVAKGPNAPNP